VADGEYCLAHRGRWNKEGHQSLAKMKEMVCDVDVDEAWQLWCVEVFFVFSV
jgi:hypothetical protein